MARRRWRRHDAAPATRVPTCQAPHSMLRLTPDGRALVCCANDQYSLGLIGRQTLREIWDGAARSRIGAALDQLDYSLGCQDCGTDRFTGNRDRSIESYWDHFAADPGPHEWPRRIEFALSNTCNLQCIQCNGDRSSSIRSQREHRPPMAMAYDEAFFAELDDFLPHLESADFAGGEPFLERESRRVWDRLMDQGLRPRITVTTNGTVFDERVAHYVRELRMEVQVSMDGLSRETFEAIRVGADHAAVRANVQGFIDLARSFGGSVSLNYCLMPQNWHELADFLLWAEELGVRTDVLPVKFPVRFNLLNLPIADLRGVLGHLEARDAELRARLEVNADAWSSNLRTIRHRLELEGTGGVPVELTARRPVDVASDLVASHRADLEAWAGQSPMVVHLDGGIVHSVETPPWAGPFDTSRWVGWPSEVLLTDIVERFGELRDFEATPLAEGLQQVAYVLEVGGQRVPLRTLVSADALVGATPVAFHRLVDEGAAG